MIALVGFGFDSWIEVAAAVVLHRLRAEIRHGQVGPVKERRALRFIAITFFALAPTSPSKASATSSPTPAPTPPVGIAPTGLSIIIMPWLAYAKRKAGLAMNSRLGLADAAETKLCAWLSVSTFAGLLGFALLGWTWIDPVAGFVIATFAIMEGKEAWEGEPVEDDGHG